VNPNMSFEFFPGQLNFSTAKWSEPQKFQRLLRAVGGAEQDLVELELIPASAGAVHDVDSRGRQDGGRQYRGRLGCHLWWRNLLKWKGDPRDRAAGRSRFNHKEFAGKAVMS